MFVISSYLRVKTLERNFAYCSHLLYNNPLTVPFNYQLILPVCFGTKFPYNVLALAVRNNKETINIQ